MRADTRTDRQRLEDIQVALVAIEEHAAHGWEAFAKDAAARTIILHNRQIIGEACRRISREIQDRHSDVAWREFVEMRNTIVHEYWQLDFPAIWATIENRIPVLKRQMEEILRDLESDAC